MPDMSKLVPWVITGAAVVTAVGFVVQSGYEASRPLAEIVAERCGNPSSLLSPWNTQGEDVRACNQALVGEDLEIFPAMSMEWDETCLNDAGWTLAGTVATPPADSAFDTRAEVSQCARLTPTAEQCAEFVRSLDHGPSGWAVLRAINCTTSDETVTASS